MKSLLGGNNMLKGQQEQTEAVGGLGRAAGFSGEPDIEAPRDVKSMERACQILVEQRERLSALVYELEKRIGGILKASPAAPSAGSGQNQANSRSVLVEGLFNQSALLRQIGDHLEGIIDRVDL